MHILMINQPLNNRGDESAHRALVRTILKHQPDVRITVVFLRYNAIQIGQFVVRDERVNYVRIETPENDGIWYSAFGSLVSGNRNVIKKKASLPASLELFRQMILESDLVLNAPGGICMGGFQDWGHLDELRIVKNFRKPIAYYGRSFGPFPTETEDNRKFKALSLEMLHYFSFLSIRDGKTMRLADELNISYVPTVDCAFLEQPRVELPCKLKSVLGTSSYSVFVPNLLSWHYAYRKGISRSQIIEFYCQIAKVSLEAFPDLNIVMLPQTMLLDSKDENDVNLFREIATQMGDTRIKVINDTSSSDIQQTIISAAHHLIGVRYHSVVFAINNNVPFIALSYEHKIEGLLELLGKTDCMVDISSKIFTEKGRNEIVEAIRGNFKTLHRDPVAQVQAKKIAWNCYERFSSSMLRRNKWWQRFWKG